MLVLLSPAKSMDLDNPLATKKHTISNFVDESTTLVDELRSFSPSDLSNKLAISEKLGQLNFERYQNWEPPLNEDHETKQAISLFAGDVYQGFDASSLTAAQLTQAQKTVRILSGLYGLIKPLDLIMPYRLEMGSKVKLAGTNNLYEYWKPLLAKELNSSITKSPGDPIIINLASNEYFKSVDKSLLKPDVVAPRFLDSKDGENYKIVSFYAKKARGAMARWIVTEKPENLEDLGCFNLLGYNFSKSHSTFDEPAFIRTNN